MLRLLLDGCPEGWINTNHRCIQVVSDKLSYENATERCLKEHHGGRLFQWKITDFEYHVHVSGARECTSVNKSSENYYEMLVIANAA